MADAFVVPKTDQLSKAEQLRRTARIGGPWDGWCGFKLTGARSHATTGWGKWNSTKTVDIAQVAAAQDNPGDNIYNNWIAQGQHPRYDVLPSHLGIYLGAGLASQDPADFQYVKSLILENSRFELKTTAAKTVLLQPCLSLHAGAGILQSTTDLFAFTEQHGPVVPQGMYEIPQSGYSEGRQDFQILTTETVQMMFSLDPDAQAELVAMTGSFPDQGALISVRMMGRARYVAPVGISG